MCTVACAGLLTWTLIWAGSGSGLAAEAAYVDAGFGAAAAATAARSGSPTVGRWAAIHASRPAAATSATISGIGAIGGIGATGGIGDDEDRATSILSAFRGSPGLSRQALAAALAAVARSRGRGVVGREDRLALIDFTLPSTEPRFWVLDLERAKVLFRELVAHGSGSGDNYATSFSNLDKSRQSSLGLFLTADTYEGANGYSLRLHGLDRGVNDQALERKIVIHGAWYVSAEHAARFGRLGRSWGCPALPLATAATIIDAIKDGTYLYAFHSGALHPGGDAPGAAAASRRRPQENPAIG